MSWLTPEKCVQLPLHVFPRTTRVHLQDRLVPSARQVNKGRRAILESQGWTVKQERKASQRYGVEFCQVYYYFPTLPLLFLGAKALPGSSTSYGGRNSFCEIRTLSHSGEMSERLVRHLRNLGAKRLYFAGALTKACVMFSANSAFTLGFEGRAAI